MLFRSICFIADCVINTIDDTEYFSINDIWDSQYFSKNVKAIYNKPNANNPTAKHEYDKFIQQPLKMLAYAHIIETKKENGKNIFKIINKTYLHCIWL